jgi:hypothetical protein
MGQPKSEVASPFAFVTTDFSEPHLGFLGLNIRVSLKVQGKR